MALVLAAGHVSRDADESRRRAWRPREYRSRTEPRHRHKPETRQRGSLTLAELRGLRPAGVVGASAKLCGGVGQAAAACRPKRTRSRSRKQLLVAQASMRGASSFARPAVLSRMWPRHGMQSETLSRSDTRRVSVRNRTRCASPWNGPFYPNSTMSDSGGSCARASSRSSR
jgi:hypothetical protein